MISFLLFILAAASYTVSQHAQHKGDTSQNKYRQPAELAPKTWYYKLFALKYRERFPLSGSLLVFTTDRYHLFQMIFKLFLCAAFGFYKPLFQVWYLEAALYFVMFGVCFTILYRLLKT